MQIFFNLLLILFYLNIFEIQVAICDEQKNGGVAFYLRTKASHGKIKLEVVNGMYQAHPEFDVSKRTFLIAQNSASDMDVGLINKLENALLEWGDVNVITLMWTRESNTGMISNRLALSLALMAVTVVSITMHITIIINAEVKHSKSFGYLHFVGIGQGAHILGEMAVLLKNQHAQWLPNRVTGLDPFGPIFEDIYLHSGLNKSAAPFVDVIHTNGRKQVDGGIGLYRRAGHVDFYVNGGKVQPGCESKDISLLKANKDTCSHARAVELFIETLQPSSNCWARVWNEKSKSPEVTLETQCKKAKCIEMGIHAENYKGKFDSAFYSVTNSEPLFCTEEEEPEEPSLWTRIVNKVKSWFG